MISGPRDRRIVIQSPGTPTVNAMGEQIPNWETVATLWAKYMPLRDSERLQAAQVQSTITVRFQVLWSLSVDQVDERHRVLFDGRVFDVVGVKEIGRREGLELSCAATSERVS